MLLTMLMLSASVPLRGGQGVLAQARTLAEAGDHSGAITLLQEFVAGAPGAEDARVFLGTVLSWAGRYDEARAQLESVLDRYPNHDDALMASVNLELWSKHAERAEALAQRGLEQRPADPRYLLALARARDLKNGLRPWQARVTVSRDSFNDNRAAWQEAQVGLSRTTAIGPVTLRGWRAERFGLGDRQFEIEAYPQIRAGTYAYVAAAFSPAARLYPHYRYAADLYQRMGAGFEGSAGFRRLGFGDGVNVYVGSLSKYHGQWLMTGRAFFTPAAPGAARAYHGVVRRYIGEGGAWVAVRYGRGAVREELRNLNDLEALDSSVIAVESTIVHRHRIELHLLGSYSREDRADRRDLRQYSMSSGVAFRF